MRTVRITRSHFDAVGILAAILGTVVLLQPSPVDAAPSEPWPPVSQEELDLRGIPEEPGASAVLLRRENHRNDNEGTDTSYFRIKILTDAGKKYADVGIPFVKDVLNVETLEARTIRPDGSVVPFSGQVYEKTVVKYRRLSILAKTFTFPEVQAGSIIEYRYALRWAQLGWLIPTRWDVQHELFTLRAHFTVKYSRVMPYSFISYLPAGRKVQEMEGGGVELRVENVPAFPVEEYMPPADSLKYRVNFFYTGRGLTSPNDFWFNYGKRWTENVERYLQADKKLKQEAERLTVGGSSPEAKLRTLYRRAQQVRNLTFEESSTVEEQKREKRKPREKVGDVLELGYGTSQEVTLLFVALARAAGFQASYVAVPPRDQVVFERQYLDARQVNDEVALVMVGTEERFFDPGTPLCPFGDLAWEKVGVEAMRLENNWGRFILIPLPKPAEATVQRKGRFRLDPDGGLRGHLEVEYKGREALERRLEARWEDETERRQKLEEEIRHGLPAGSEAKLIESGSWEESDQPLRAKFELHIQSLGAPTGRRLLLPLGVLHTERVNPFEPAKRVHPIQFPYPYEHVDEIVVEIPEGFELEGLPEPRNRNSVFGSYEIRAELDGGFVHITRGMSVAGIRYPNTSYAALRDFFSAVRAGDTEQMVLRAVAHVGE